MFTSNYTKLFLLSIAIVLSSTSCRFFQNKVVESDPLKTFDKSEKSAPFQTKEPDIFQTEIVASTYLNSETSHRKYFMAKKNLNSYTAFNFGEDNETAIIETAGGKHFVLDKKNRSFREKKLRNSKPERSELQDFLTTKWLNEKRNTRVEKISTENGVAKYRVTIDDSKTSEILIFVDEKLHVPIKQEFYKVSGEKKELTFNVELKNIKSEAPDELFEVPEDYAEIESQ